MKNIELRKKISSAIAEEFEKKEELFEPDAILKETLELDSLSLVDLVALVEEVTGVSVGNEDVKHINTFEDLYNFVEKKLEE